MQRKHIIWFIVFSMAFLLSACNKPGDVTELQSSLPGESDEYSVEMKEVIFCNMYWTDASLESEWKNRIINFYEEPLFDENDKDALYAFYVTKDLYGEVIEQEAGETAIEYQKRKAEISSKYAVDSALELGLMVLESHPYCVYNQSEEGYPQEGICVIVGTAEQITTLFDDTELWKQYEKWVVMPAVRPDFPEVLEQIGRDGDEVIGLGTYLDDIQKIIGKDEKVTLTVPVIIPEAAETIDEALAAGRITMEDLDAYGIEYSKKEK